MFAYIILAGILLLIAGGVSTLFANYLELDKPSLFYGATFGRWVAVALVFPSVFLGIAIAALITASEFMLYIVHAISKPSWEYSRDSFYADWASFIDWFTTKVPAFVSAKAELL